jgi:hypothetical protein
VSWERSPPPPPTRSTAGQPGSWSGRTLDGRGGRRIVCGTDRLPFL